MSGAAELGQLGSVITVDSTTGNVGIGAAPSFKLDVIQSSGTIARFGSTAGSTAGGAIIQSTSANAGIFGSGTDFNGTSWTARATSASLVSCDTGSIVFYGNSSLVAGNTFTPTPFGKFDSTGNFLIVSTGGIGYGTGSGGTVTQLTSKSTGVTLNKTNGAIAMNAASLAAGTTVGFTFTNSNIAFTDMLLTQVVIAASGAQNYQTWANCGTGNAGIYLRNISAGALAEAVTITFALIKSVTA